jgi:hypothetical protein
MPTYTPEKTWTSEVITQSDLNTYLRDNVDYVKAQTDGLAFSGCKVNRSAAQSINDSTSTLISYTAEDLDFGAWFPGSGTTVTVPAGAIPSGYTSIALMAVARTIFASNGTGWRRLIILKNGGQEDGMSVSAITGDTTDLGIVSFMTAVAGDTITVQVYQTSGGALNSTGNKLSVVRFAPAS